MPTSKTKQVKHIGQNSTNQRLSMGYEPHDNAHSLGDVKERPFVHAKTCLLKQPYNPGALLGTHTILDGLQHCCKRVPDYITSHSFFRVRHALHYAWNWPLAANADCTTNLNCATRSYALNAPPPHSSFVHSQKTHKTHWDIPSMMSPSRCFLGPFLNKLLGILCFGCLLT